MGTIMVESLFPQCFMQFDMNIYSFSSIFFALSRELMLYIFYEEMRSPTERIE